MYDHNKHDVYITTRFSVNYTMKKTPTYNTEFRYKCTSDFSLDIIEQSVYISKRDIGRAHELIDDWNRCGESMHGHWTYEAV